METVDETTKNQSHNQVKMDDLFELFNSDESPNTKSTPENVKLKQASQSESIQRSNDDASSQINPQRSLNNESFDASLSCEFSHIRIINRIIGRDRLKQLITEELSLSFKNVCQIAALSKAKIEAMEDEGVNNLCTIAVVTKRGGTLVSKSNGAAFCVLELGTFVSSSSVGIGTMASLFLFGEAYSKFVANKSLRNGSVILLMCPKIFPSKPGSDTAVSFSIRDSDRIMLVGTAKDFGTCGGTSFRGAKCKRLIDLRRGQFCNEHKSLATKSSSSATIKLRDQMVAYRVPISGQVKPYTSSNTNKLVQARGNGVVSLSNLNRQHGSRVGPTNNAHEASISLILVQNSSNSSKPYSKVTNPYSKRQKLSGDRYKSASTVVSQRREGLKENNSTKNYDLLGGLLKCKKTDAKTALKENKDRSLASIAGGNLNGQVYVPPPSAILFGKKNNVKSENLNNRPHRIVSGNQASEQRKEAILKKQKELVSGSGSKRFDTPVQGMVKSTQFSNKKKSSPTSVGDALFDTIEIHDLEKAMTATSKFANEAMAEQYAQSRMVVTELEKKEALTENRNKKNTNKVVHTKWVCSVCSRTTSYQPKDCIRSNHPIRIERSLSKLKKDVPDNVKSKKNIGDKDDALRLASGLEWSGWKGGTYAN